MLVSLSGVGGLVDLGLVLVVVMVSSVGGGPWGGGRVSGRLLENGWVVVAVRRCRMWCMMLVAAVG